MKIKFSSRDFIPFHPIYVSNIIMWYIKYPASNKLLMIVIMIYCLIYLLTLMLILIGIHLNRFDFFRFLKTVKKSPVSPHSVLLHSLNVQWQSSKCTTYSNFSVKLNIQRRYILEYSTKVKVCHVCSVKYITKFFYRCSDLSSP